MKLIPLLYLFLVSCSIYTQAQTACGFGYKKEIVIQASQVIGSGSHTDFPILISETDNDLRHTGSGGNVTNVNGFDILFYDDNCVVLEHQIERYVSTTGEFAAWVKIPSLSTSTNTTIHMVYGNTNLTTDPSTTNVWDNNFESVWHFNNNSFLDGTANGNTSTNGSSSNNASSKIAGGRTFNGTTDYVQTPTAGMSTAAGTIELWGNASNFSANHHYFYGHTTNPAYANRIQLYTNDAGGNLDLGLGNSHGKHNNIQNLNTSQWYHIVLTWDGTNYAVYVDGASAATGTYTGLTNLNTFGDLGNDGNTGTRDESMDGSLDELRISSIERSANWIATSHNAQNSPSGTFYTISGENDISHTSIQDGDWDDVAIWDSGVVPDDGFATVVINHDVDIDASSADYTICSCEINGNGTQNAFLDVSSSRILMIKENFDAIYSGAGALEVRLQVTNTAQVLVGQEMNWARTNTNTGDFDLEILLTDNAIVTAGGVFYPTLSAGDDLNIDLNDNSIFTTNGMRLNQDGGDKMFISVDDNAKMELNAGAVFTHTGGDDILVHTNANSGNAGKFIVNGPVFINHTGGDDIQFSTDDVNSAITITGNLTANLNGTSDDQILDFDLDNGDFTVNAVSISRGADNGFVHFDLDGGDFTSSNMTLNSGGTLFNDGYIYIEVDEASVFTVNGFININMSGGDDFRLAVNDNAGTDAQFNCTSNFTITRTDGDDIEFSSDDDNSLIHIGGNLTIASSGGEEIVFNLDNDGIIDIDGNITIDYSEGQDCEIDLEFNAGNADPLFNVDGNFTLTNSAGDDEWLFDLNGGTFQVDGDMTVINSGSGGNEDILIEIDEDAELNVNGNLRMELSGGDDLSIELGNNSTNSTAQLNVGTDLTLDHNGNTGGDDMFINFRDNTRGTVGDDLILDSDFSSNDQLFVRLNTTSELTVGNDIEFYAATDGKTELEINNTAILHIGGNFVRQNSPNDFGILDCNNTATVEYNGTTAQEFAQDTGAGTDEFDYQNVIINNTFGTPPQLTMEGLATVHTSITFTDGVVASTAVNLLVVDDNAASVGASNASHVDGEVRKTGNEAFTFPVGDDDNYQPIAISAPALTTDHFTARYNETDPDPPYDDSSLVGSIHHISSCEYWILDRTNGSSDVSVTLAWDANSCIVNDMPILLVARWDGSQWQDEGNGGTTGNNAAGTVVSSAPVTNFSPFTLASYTSNNPLPIELVLFTGRKKGNVNVLNWETATEINNDYFTVERSIDGRNFTEVGNVTGAGNSNTLLSYELTDDAPIAGINYYRLKQTDFDGNFTYSSIIAIHVSNNTEVEIYPNPADDFFVVNINGTPETLVSLSITNVAGQLVHQQQISATGLQKINTNLLPKGVYMVSITSESFNLPKRLVVK